MINRIKFNSIIIICLFCSYCKLYGQDSISTNEFPNIEYDILEDKKNFHDFYLAIGNLTGIGIKSTFDLKNNFYLSPNLELGGSYGDPYDGAFADLDMRMGYSFFSRVKKKTGRWIHSESVSYRYYYDVDVPVHRDFSVEAGFNNNYLLSFEHIIDSSFNHFSPVLFNLGIRWKSYIYSFLNVIDEDIGIHRRGKYQSFGELYFGLVLPIHGIDNSTNPFYSTQTKSKIGINASFKMPGFSNHGTSFIFSYSSVGYGGYGNSQFMFGYSWNLGFLDKKYFK